MKLTIIRSGKKLLEVDDWVGLVPPPVVGDIVKIGKASYRIDSREIEIEDQEQKFISRRPSKLVAWVESIRLFVARVPDRKR